MNQRLLATSLVSVAVGLNVTSAVILKETADKTDKSFLIIGILLFLVFLINMVRVMFWATIHKRFELSVSYPLTSLFFPLILIVSALYGEDLSLYKILGTGIITLGVLISIKG